MGISKNKKTLKMKYFIGKTLFILLLITSCKKEVIVKNYEVKYEVKGTGSPFTVSYLNDVGATINETSIVSGWNKSITIKSKDRAWLKAKNAGAGYVKINIFIDGQLIKTSECTSPFCLSEVSYDAE